jgi:hemoglobin
MSKTLYEQIGDEKLLKLLNAFYDKIFSHPELTSLFQDSERNEVQKKQFLFIRQFLGGPMDYNDLYGPPMMRKRHLPHKITPKAKDIWLACMKESVYEQEWDDRLKDVFYTIFPPIAAHMVNSEDE